MNKTHDFVQRIGFDNVKKVIRNKARENFNSTEWFWEYLDCKGKNGKDIYQLLVNGRLWIRKPTIDLEYLPTEKAYSAFFWLTYSDPALIWGSFLTDFKGTLFVDNLECDNKSNEEVMSFCQLADEIKNNKVSVKWLIAYTRDPVTFPKYFKEQFELVSLDSKDSEVEEQKEKTVVEPVAEIAESADIKQYILCVN